MKTYRVVWEIDIEADTPLLAAWRALKIQRNPESIATQFYVWEHGESERVSIAFLKEDEEPVFNHQAAADGLITFDHDRATDGLDQEV